MTIKNLLFLMTCIHMSYSYGMSRLPSPLRPRALAEQRRQELIYAAVQLYTEVKSGDVAKVQHALTLPFANINYRYACSKFKEFTLLLFATEANDIKMCEFLLKNGAHINIKAHKAINNEWNIVSPISIAVTYNLQELVKLFIQYNVHLHSSEYINSTPLHHAAFNNHTSLVELLIDAGACVNSRDWNDTTPLHLAVADNYIETIQTLLKKDADPNAQDINGNTPLHYAVQQRSLESIRELIFHNADISIANNENHLPYELISDCDAHPQLLELLRPQ